MSSNTRLRPSREDAIGLSAARAAAIDDLMSRGSNRPKGASRVENPSPGKNRNRIGTKVKGKIKGEGKDLVRKGLLPYSGPAIAAATAAVGLPSLAGSENLRSIHNVIKGPQRTVVNGVNNGVGLGIGAITSALLPWPANVLAGKILTEKVTSKLNPVIGIGLD